MNENLGDLGHTHILHKAIVIFQPIKNGRTLINNLVKNFF